MKEKITKKLESSLDCSHLEVINESYLHAGHMGDDGSGESHFKIIIAAKDFIGLNRVKIHRKIHDILKNELKNIHALAIKILS